MNFRLDAKNLFLTYPQCNLSRERALELLLAKPWGSATVVAYCVAQEKHADGNPHLHCLILLDKRKNISSNSWLDLDGFHGNYQAAKNKDYVHDYCTKADDQCLNTITRDMLRSEKSVTRAKFAQAIMAGEKAEELVEKYPQFLFGFTKLQADIRALEEAKTMVPDLPKWIPNPWGKLIESDSQAKKRHWWIYSRSPNRGKTTWAREMEHQWKALIKSGDFSYWNVSGKEKLIILDEYNTAGLKFSALNQLADGYFEARVIYVGLRRLKPNLVIVLSNCSIIDLYPHMHHLVSARFIEYEIL